MITSLTVQNGVSNLGTATAPVIELGGTLNSSTAIDVGTNFELIVGNNNFLTPYSGNASLVVNTRGGFPSTELLIFHEIVTGNPEITFGTLFTTQRDAAFGFDTTNSVGFWEVNGRSGVFQDGIGRLGIGTPTPTQDIHVFKAVGSARLFLQTTASSVSAVVMEADRSGSNQGVARVDGQWAGNLIGRIEIVTGFDLINKDEGDIRMLTVDAGGGLVEHWRLTKDGNVGIGTPTPSAKLQVQRNDDSDSAIYLFNGNIGTSASASVIVQNGTANAQFTSYNANFTTAQFADRSQIRVLSGTGLDVISSSIGGDIRWYTNGVLTSDEKMRLLSTGELGLGTQTPSQVLHLFRLSNAVRIFLQTPSDSITGARFDSNRGAVNQPLARIEGQWNGNTVGRIQFVGAVENVFKNSGDIAFTTFNAGVETERMRILYDGNIGIGTASPIVKFHVQDATNTALTGLMENTIANTNASASWVALNDSVSVQLSAFSPSYTAFPQFAGRGQVRVSVGSGLDLIASDGSGDMRFYTGGTAAGNERMRITSTGFIGIGTTTPVADVQISKSTNVALNVNATGNFFSELQLWNSVVRWNLQNQNVNGRMRLRDATNGRNIIEVEPLSSNNSLWISSQGRIGLFTSSPQTRFHVAGVGASTGPAVGVFNIARFINDSVAGNGATVSIISGTAAAAQLTFGDSGSEAQGLISYNNGIDSMEIFVTGNKILTLNSSGVLGVGNITPPGTGVVRFGTPTENFDIVDAGSAGATEQDWVEVRVGGVTGYLRVFATT